MSYKDENRIEKLERQIEELKEELKNRPTKDETIRDMEDRLTVYDDTIRSDKGEIILKKNFIIKNRRSALEDDDNVATFNFNRKLPGETNYIYFGSEVFGPVEDRERVINASYIDIAAKKDDNNPTREVVANGTILANVVHDDDKVSGLEIVDQQSAGLPSKGYLSILSVDQRGDNSPLSGLSQRIDMGGELINAISFHTVKDIQYGGVYRQHLKHYVDLVPAYDGGIVPSLGRVGNAYSRLVLRSPDGSSWAVTIDNSGNLQTNKL